MQKSSLSANQGQNNPILKSRGEELSFDIESKVS